MRAVVEHCHPESEGEWLNVGEFVVDGRRLDLMAIRLWRERLDDEPDRPGIHLRHAYEVKVERADLLHELRRPEKRLPGMEVSHQFSFAVPPGLMAWHEVPEGCGLVEVDDDGGVWVRRAAPIRKPRRLTMSEVVRLLRAEHVGPSMREWRERARRAEFEVKILREQLDNRGAIR